MKDIVTINPDLVKTVVWKNDPVNYDQSLYQLGRGQARFLIVNPDCGEIGLKQFHLNFNRFINLIPQRTEQCWIFYYNGQWIAKYFTDNWQKQYQEVVFKEEIVYDMAEHFEYNYQDLKHRIEFKQDPSLIYKVPEHEQDYELVWYMDTMFTEGQQIWAYRYRSVDVPKGQIDKGKITPIYQIEYNKIFPKDLFTLDTLLPYYKKIGSVNTFVIKNVTTTKREVLWYCRVYFNYLDNISRSYYHDLYLDVEYNPELPKLTYDSIKVNIINIRNEHVWYLDKKYAPDSRTPIWAARIKLFKNYYGQTTERSLQPKFYVKKKKFCETLELDISDFNPELSDFNYEHIWYTYIDGKKVNLLSGKFIDEPRQKKYYEYKHNILPTRLDVVFISYYEKNAEENWKRVKIKAPWAKRVKNVQGIDRAHRAAANLVTTDMFYIVDGDAWLVDDWQFDFQPSLYDRQVTHIWRSKNPFNDLDYGYGGVKLFSKSLILNTDNWQSLDYAGTVSKRLRVMDQISNETRFNVDEFSTWRSAFREGCKLYWQNDLESLGNWVTNKSGDFAKIAQQAIEQAIDFCKKNRYNKKAMLKINDYKWLKQHYVEQNAFV